MSSYYDEDGNEVEGILSPDEAKAMQEKTEALQKELEEKSGELDKLSTKDINFEKMRKLNTEERREAQEGWSEEKKLLVNEMTALNEKIEGFQSANLGNYKEQLLKELAGSDEELVKQLEERASEFRGDLNTTDDIYDRYSKAFLLIKGERPTVNPINQFVPSTHTSMPTNDSKKFTDTESGKKAYQKFFPDSNYGKPKES